MPLFWFKSYFHATVTTQSGSCSKRTHLCHHKAFRVDTALLKCMLSIFTTLCSHEPARLNKRASMFTSTETRSDMCLSNMSETSAVKTRQDACQLWRMTSRAAEDSTASEASCNKQCMCQQKKKARRSGRVGVAAGRIAATYGFHVKIDQTVRNKDEECSLEIGYGWFDSFLVVFPCPQRLKNYS